MTKQEYVSIYRQDALKQFRASLDRLFNVDHLNLKKEINIEALHEAIDDLEYHRRVWERDMLSDESSYPFPTPDITACLKDFIGPRHKAYVCSDKTDHRGPCHALNAMGDDVKELY